MYPYLYVCNDVYLYFCMFVMMPTYIFMFVKMSVGIVSLT